MEVIVQKATELGAEQIIPVYMKRSVPKDKGSMSKKVERWQRVALEASKQSRRIAVAEVSEPVNFTDAVQALADYDLILFPYESEQNATIKDVIVAHEHGDGSHALRIAVFIGPEGGFADEEALDLIAAGAAPCSLGRTILRTETAGAAVLAMLRYAYDL
jgi:16S rRNA (uracil1498-N3)-methyltransferase